jgi:hypothetical protein
MKCDEKYGWANQTFLKKRSTIQTIQNLHKGILETLSNTLCKQSINRGTN